MTENKLAPYFIRREATYDDGERSVTFWCGEADPYAWAFHPSDAARFKTATGAGIVFERATGHPTGVQPNGDLVTTVGGTWDTPDKFGSVKTSEISA